MNTPRKLERSYSWLGSNLAFEILPGRFNQKFVATPRYDLAFNFWRKFWDEVLLENKSSERIPSYDFLRADYIGVIFHGDEVVSMNLHSHLNLSQVNIESHPYFATENEIAFGAKLREMGRQTILTHEYLTLNREWRKSKIGVSLAPVLAALGYRLQVDVGADASVGRCRQDNGVNRLMTDVGGSVVIAGVMMYNTLTDFCQVPTATMFPHADIEIQNLTKVLWDSRRDWTAPEIHFEKEKRSA